MDVANVILIVSGLVSLGTIIGLFVRLTWWLSVEFSKMRKLTYDLHSEMSRRMLRLELWANRHGYQPGLPAAIEDFSGNGNGGYHA